MRAVVVGDHVTLSGREHVRSSVAKLVHQLAIEHVDDVSALAPVIGNIARRIFDDARANVSDLQRSPGRNACLTAMLGRRDARPVDRLEGNIGELHADEDYCLSGNTSSVPHRSLRPSYSDLVDRRGLLREGDVLVKTGDYRAALDKYAVVARSFASDGVPLKALALWRQVREIIRQHVPSQIELDTEAHGALVTLCRSLGLESDAKALESAINSDPKLN